MPPSLPWSCILNLHSNLFLTQVRLTMVWAFFRSLMASTVLRIGPQARPLSSPNTMPQTWQNAPHMLSLSLPQSGYLALGNELLGMPYKALLPKVASAKRYPKSNCHKNAQQTLFPYQHPISVLPFQVPLVERSA